MDARLYMLFGSLFMYLIPITIETFKSLPESSWFRFQLIGIGFMLLGIASFLENIITVLKKIHDKDGDKDLRI